MKGRKWCVYCNINIPWDKAAINDHQSTRQHIHNKQRHIKFQRIKIKREEKQKRQDKESTPFISSANIPKAKKNSQLQKQINQYRQNVYDKGKAAIHSLIAQKTQGRFGAPIQFPQKDELVLAENYIQEQTNPKCSTEPNYRMWKIDVCQETGQPCFINVITQAKLYEPPKGYVLSAEEREEWEQIVEMCKQQANEPDQHDIGRVGEWEQVSEQDYFKVNQVDSQYEDNKQKGDENNYGKKKAHREQDQIKKQQFTKQQGYETKLKRVDEPYWMQQLKLKVSEDKVSTSEIFQTVIENKLKECKNIKEKNEILKKLIKSGIEVHKWKPEEIEHFKQKSTPINTTFKKRKPNTLVDAKDKANG